MPTAIESILENCDIYFDDELISRENIIEKYFSFLTNVLNPEKRTVGIALHTGSICFDVISIVAVGIGCLSYNLATNDDIITRLQPGQMVMYKRQRYRWLGKEVREDILYLVLEQDGVGRNGPSKLLLPYDRNKHLISPYYGNSQKTDGRGVKKANGKREEFLSYVFELPITEVPAEFDISVVIVANRKFFANVCKKVRIEYGDNKSLNLLDVIPASYFTNGGIQHQFGVNPTKVEPVMKVTENFSIARELVLDKHGNRVIGLLVFGSVIPVKGSSELSDLLRRKALNFAVVEAPIHSKFGESALELYEDVSVFACTKEYLAIEKKSVRFSNKYTEELAHQASTIINNTIIPIRVDGGIDSAEYKNIRKKLLVLKHSNMSRDIRDKFILTAQGMINLLNTAVFTMNDMEEAIRSEVVDSTVKSPQMRINYLWELAESATTMQDLCIFIADAIERQYQQMRTVVPKAELLHDYIEKYIDSRIVIILPKAYYIDILRNNFPQLVSHPNIVCVTPNRFDTQSEYDLIVVAGEISNHKFDLLSCHSVISVEVLLYDCEKSTFLYHKNKAEKYERVLNGKIGVVEESLEKEISRREQYEDEEMQMLSSLDEYTDSFSGFDVHKLAASSRQSGGSLPTSEVTHLGVFVSGEQVLFSKYYSAVVFDAEKETIIEKPPADLRTGDILVFNVRNDYTQNIVDTIYERLLSSGHLSKSSSDMYEKSQYWKECLREFKGKNGFTYGDIAKKFRKYGSTLQDVTIRQWLVEDSHIVGPRNEKTMNCIAQVTEDPFLLGDVGGYFEACKYVRHERRRILKWIANAINDNLKGVNPERGSILEVVYDNIENLSETKELEDILELNESVEININLVNRPITEMEV